MHGNMKSPCQECDSTTTKFKDLDIEVLSAGDIETKVRENRQ